ncbi:MAG: acyl-CoA dehydrogenase family protein [Chloroflexi bacterium]|nr:acyl-CoA dehydrogenase family protein [Chloroflexota bacterium]
MDFELEQSKDLQAFRKEVREWIEANLPPPISTRDRRKETLQDFKNAREFHRKLGAKGWRVPWAPKEYGGLGLSIEKTLIIDEELDKVEDTIASLDDNGPGVILPPILTYGTEEQKQTWARGIIEGRQIWWQGLTEPEAGSDLASAQTRAVPDGNDWLISGNKIFQGSGYEQDMYYVLAISHPDRPRHHNFSVFCFSLHLPGVSWSPMRLIATDRNSVYMDNVRVPSSAILGQPGQGWQVTQAQLEVEHGYGGAVRPDRVVPKVLDFMREGPKKGGPIAGDAVLRDRYVDNFIGSRVGVLFQLRNLSQRLNKQFGSYEGSQNILHDKVYGVQQAARNLEITGLYGLMDDEHEAPSYGDIEAHQRGSIVFTHPAGTIEVHKVIMARRIGMSATRERAAATV